MSDFQLDVKDPETKRLLEAVAKPEEWAVWANIWLPAVAQAETAGIAAERFFLMVAFNLGAGIGGQAADTPEASKKRDNAIALAWHMFQHGAHYAGMDMHAWKDRLERQRAKRRR